MIHHFPLVSGKLHVILAIPCDNGVGQESVNRGKTCHWGELTFSRPYTVMDEFWGKK